MPNKLTNQPTSHAPSTPLRSEVVSLDEIVVNRGAHLQAALDELLHNTPAGHGRKFCFAKSSSGEQFARSVAARARAQGLAIKTRCQNRGAVVYLWAPTLAAQTSSKPAQAIGAAEKPAFAGHRVVESLSFTRPSKPALAALGSEPDYVVLKDAADDAGEDAGGDAGKDASETEATGKRRISFAAACMRTTPRPEG